VIMADGESASFNGAGIFAGALAEAVDNELVGSLVAHVISSSI